MVRYLGVILICLMVAWHIDSPARERSLQKLYKEVNPSVVIIRTEARALAGSGKRKSTQVSGLGSGVLISEDGKVLTAAHVVQTSNFVEVKFLDGTSVQAQVVSSVVPADIALLQLSELPKEAAVARLGDSDKVEVGEKIFVVGAPYGIGHTLTVGHVSARHAPNTLNTVMDGLELGEFFQTDAAINTGNSGGPMFNMNGEVIGIVSYILSKSGGFEGLGFAVTSNKARDMMLQAPSFWSGMEGYRLSGDLTRIFNVPQRTGILVQRAQLRSGSMDQARAGPRSLS